MLLLGSLLAGPCSDDGAIGLMRCVWWTWHSGVVCSVSDRSSMVHGHVAASLAEAGLTCMKSNSSSGAWHQAGPLWIRKEHLELPPTGASHVGLRKLGKLVSACQTAKSLSTCHAAKV